MKKFKTETWKMMAVASVIALLLGSAFFLEMPSNGKIQGSIAFCTQHSIPIGSSRAVLEKIDNKCPGKDSCRTEWSRENYVLTYSVRYSCWRENESNLEGVFYSIDYDRFTNLSVSERQDLGGSIN